VNKELAPGEIAPSFTLSRLDGPGTIAGPSLGALTLLIFAKASCPTCRWAMPYVQRLHEETKGGSLAVVGIVQDDADTERAVAAELGLTFLLAHEEAPWSTADAYGLTTVPTFFLVDGSGRTLVASAGFARDELVDIARRAADLDGGPPASPFPEGEDVPVYRPG